MSAKFLFTHNGTAHPIGEISNVIDERIQQLLLLKVKENVESRMLKKLSPEEFSTLTITISEHEKGSFSVAISGNDSIINKIKD